MSAELFPTITGVHWSRQIARARIEVAQANARIRAIITAHRARINLRHGGSVESGGSYSARAAVTHSFLKISAGSHPFSKANDGAQSAAK